MTHRNAEIGCAMLTLSMILSSIYLIMINWLAV